jgi:hypothetical protein
VRSPKELLSPYPATGEADAYIPLGRRYICVSLKEQADTYIYLERGGIKKDAMRPFGDLYPFFMIFAVRT